MVSYRIRKTIIMAGLVVIICTILKVHHDTYSDQGNIYMFDSICDMRAILDIFKQSWRELVEDDNFSPEYMMLKRKPDKNTKCVGPLRIRVMREKNKLAGFTAYYMEDKQKGMVFLLAVDRRFRGKGYGKRLTQYAIEDLLQMGACRIGLWVLIDNVPAIRIYKELGFIEKILDEGGNTYLEYLSTQSKKT
jgi:ribosomal protein S18 acetylase RimI-like enzyme